MLVVDVVGVGAVEYCARGVLFRAGGVVAAPRSSNDLYITNTMLQSFLSGTGPGVHMT